MRAIRTILPIILFSFMNIYRSSIAGNKYCDFQRITFKKNYDKLARDMRSRKVRVKSGKNGNQDDFANSLFFILKIFNHF